MQGAQCGTRSWDSRITYTSRIPDLGHNIWGLVRDPRNLQDPIQRFSRVPTWDDCRQLLQVLSTTEERERIQVEARKSVLGEDRQPPQNPDLINAAFPLSRPTRDYNWAEDDILLAAEDQDTCLRGTRDLLQTIVALGYWASAKKAQICRAEVIYLGYKLKDGQRWLTDARKETVLRIPQPQTVLQVREFLGSAGFCHLWIPGFAKMARPLYEATRHQQNF
ncbi:unnamed protein product [Nyctereutes procyonoides]|uniref:(raccoon dog) hypothetical protein n=1 Tax=Nyctereutes procyonoides TaxID=34880 RepID=A0A811YGJ6_NYCPR|nr:unnamed protein product [Nyctereutes procyonoides]